MAVMRAQRGFDRLVNFSDAVVAIAITLLILPLVDAGPDVVRDGIATYFAHNYWQLLAFAITFFVIARLWMVHHQVFGWVDGYSVGLMWLNILWLAAIVFMPFTANVLSDSPNGHADVYVLYIGDLLLATVTMQIMEVLIVRTPGMLLPDAAGQSDLLRGWTFVILMTLALVLVLFFPQVGMFWLLILFLSQPLHILLSRMFRPKAKAGA